MIKNSFLNLLIIILLISCSNDISKNPTESVRVDLFGYRTYRESYIPSSNNDYNYVVEVDIYNGDKVYDSRSIDLNNNKNEDRFYFDLEIGEEYTVEANIYNKNNGFENPVALYESESFTFGSQERIRLDEVSRNSQKIYEDQIYTIDLETLDKSQYSIDNYKSTFKIGSELWYSFEATSSMSKLTIDQDGYSVSLVVRDDHNNKSTFKSLYFYTTPGETYFFRVINSELTTPVKNKPEEYFFNIQSTYASIKVEPYIASDLVVNEPIPASLDEDLKSYISEPDIINKSQSYDTYQFKIKKNNGYLITTDIPVVIDVGQKFEDGNNFGSGKTLYIDDEYYFYTEDETDMYLSVKPIAPYMSYEYKVKVVDITTLDIPIYIGPYYGSRCTFNLVSPEIDDDIILNVLYKNEDGSFELVKEYILPVDEQKRTDSDQLFLTIDPIYNRENAFLKGALRNSEGVINSAFTSFNLVPRSSYNYFNVSFTRDFYALSHESRNNQAILNEKMTFSYIELEYKNPVKKYFNEEIEPLISRASIISKPDNSKLVDTYIEIEQDDSTFYFKITPDALGEYKIVYSCGIESNLKSNIITIICSEN